MQLRLITLLALFAVVSQSISCKEKPKSKVNKQFYDSMKAGVMAEDDANFNDSTNVFDNGDFDPANDDENKLLVTMGQTFRLDSTMMVKFDIRTPEELNGDTYHDTLVVGNETFTRDLHDITESELKNLRYNLNMIKGVKKDSGEDGNCQGEDCPVYAHVSKNNQQLKLYINGELLDTFATSTGDNNHTTPDFNTKPNGRMYRKYSSHKYPGGNWNGLGNMPYAVFIKGGYAIHGTTAGNIKKLGNPVSHGCIRLDPRNAKIFYNLVSYAGSENTWVTVADE